MIRGIGCIGGRTARCGLLALAMLAGAEAVAQSVYVTPGESGPVFSDKPGDGAKEVPLKPLSVVPAVKAPASGRSTQNGSGGADSAPTVSSGGGPAAQSGSRDDVAAESYRRFAIVFPEQNGSVVANTAVFEVRVAVDPALQVDEGHAFVVRVNGRWVEQRFTATEFMIPPEFWGDVLPPPNQRMTLAASIIDAEGRVLMDAAPVNFYLRHARLWRPRPIPPIVVPPPSTPPRRGMAAPSK
ncbi:hypothetical protein [Propionivibrio limicola]|uniref:hypothetical protein n=1 Tax=Propionivibrio limicola TaxID=167645 RepID=UPI001292B81D|nr:hypothetical protein [Propionivibrio limicola]